jgi:hypothetical protein
VPGGPQERMGERPGERGHRVGRGAEAPGGARGPIRAHPSGAPGGATRRSAPPRPPPPPCLRKGGRGGGASQGGGDGRPEQGGLERFGAGRGRAGHQGRGTGHRPGAGTAASGARTGTRTAYNPPSAGPAGCVPSGRGAWGATATRAASSSPRVELRPVPCYGRAGTAGSGPGPGDAALWAVFAGARRPVRASGRSHSAAPPSGRAARSTVVKTADQNHAGQNHADSNLKASGRSTWQRRGA